MNNSANNELNMNKCIVHHVDKYFYSQLNFLIYQYL